MRFHCKAFRDQFEPTLKSFSSKRKLESLALDSGESRCSCPRRYTLRLLPRVDQVEVTPAGLRNPTHVTDKRASACRRSWNLRCSALGGWGRIRYTPARRCSPIWRAPVTRDAARLAVVAPRLPSGPCVYTSACNSCAWYTFKTHAYTTDTRAFTIRTNRPGRGGFFDVI